MSITHVLSIGTAVVFRLLSESQAVAGTVVPVVLKVLVVWFLASLLVSFGYVVGRGMGRNS